jgi:hypothetical protein
MEELEFRYGRYPQMYWLPARGVALQLWKWVRSLKFVLKIGML